MTETDLKQCVRCGRYYPYKRILDRMWHEDDSKDCVRNLGEKK